MSDRPTTDITPTVGRVVIFRPFKTCYDFGFTVLEGQEHAATVAYVHGPRCVNLTISDVNGKTFSRTSVQLRQPGDPVPVGDYCEWMPYQVSMAKAQVAVAKVQETDSPAAA